MKRKLASLTFLVLSFVANAQNETTTTSIESFRDKPEYNQWSIELNGGFNTPMRTITAGYSTESFNPFHADLGARYMFNPKFGLKLDLGYDQFTERDNTPEFESRMIRASFQGVINLSRVLNFETWTNTFGILVHGGLGASQISSKNGLDGEDYLAHGILGMTGQIKLGNRVALTADVSGLVNTLQDFNFDGMGNASKGRPLDGVLLNASLGLTFYLGKNKVHADWFAEEDRFDELEKRVALLETGALDTDKDGVADLYDLEPNSVTGVAVNTKGQSIDNNQNGVPDELESYLEKTYGQKSDKIATNTTVEELINDGYVNVYFDFNSTKPTNASLSGIDFLVKYLKNNPNKSADVVGYADEIGSSSYNVELSRKRAEAVKQVAINAGIDASRLNVIANGEDTSVNKNSKEARQIVRRVSFQVK
ncbi:OmpA family protein [Flavobacterium hydrophilum]|uniref:Flagellar motor protein MotB n=1 Tax=Flavobacterium hydrophilum TaxID=2211445 RepID=A0A2V4C7R9_9FLAO|nr:OmpA family protein [Flavobacterium hydrophilum]PXY47047.1 flagellar motor protein MotB [Flavobacterium hydrophilum]